MNILLTNHCNRKCSYCFAQERVSCAADGEKPASPADFISDADFLTAVRFAKRSKMETIGVLGGEPSLHPRFTDLLAMAWEEGIHTKIFTNGLWREESVAFIEGLDRSRWKQVNFVLNMNGPARTPEWQERAQERLLARIGRLCSMSFNISRPDFDPFFLVDFIEKYETRRNIRLGVAQPLARMANEHIDVADYRVMVPTLMELARRCDERNISLGFDCGFTLCMFTAQELGELDLAGARFRATCGPAIDIGTDLTAWACFPLSTFSRGERLTDFEDLEALARSFRQKFEPLFETGAMPQCVTCRHRKRGRCSGGCAAHVFRKMDPDFRAGGTPS
jgi:sulfatase maturation enzyme AslB (radical SAM superfamily)